MKTVDVKASKSYQVLIEKGLLNNAHTILKNVLKCKKALIVTDDIVQKLYLEKLKRTLDKLGIELLEFVIKNGEKSKNAENYIKLLNFCAKNKLTRSDALIALGGGVVGDLTGFAAATFLRGIDFVQIPTTLLAAVDSSVGGKTGIDLDEGKNLAGAFYQPKAVLCDLDTLSTLEPDVFADGCAEVIKYAILGDEALFLHLEENKTDFQREYVVTRCVEMKRDIVMEDEFDTGKRMLLNLGHTVGHAIEKAGNFEISHGSAVAIGTAIIARAAEKNGLCTKETKDRIESILKSFNLPIKCQYDAHILNNIMLSDKKRMGDSVNVIVPRKIGECEIVKIDADKLIDFVKAGL